MIFITAKEKYELDGASVLYVQEEKLTFEDYDKLLKGEKFIFSARNENNGNKDEEGKFFTKYIGRNSCIPIKVERKPHGYHIYYKIDIENLPTTQKALDASRNF